jgi:exopolysaccharide production protein ExoQ
MRIAKSRLVQPGENLGYAVFAVSLSMFVFAYSTKFGQASILAYYAAWFPLVLVDYRKALGSYSKYGWLFAFAVFACVSTFWSQAPGVTMRASMQYITHIICALIAVRVLDVKSLTLGIVAGAFVVLLYSIAFGYHQYDALDGTYSFVGAFSSKNQLGFYASLGVYFAFAAVFILGERRIWMFVCGAVGLLGAYCLIASQSATSVIATAGVIVLIIGFRPFLALSPRDRKGIFIGGAIIFGSLAVVGLYLGATGALLGAFGKDTTLTGRTYLWQQGIQAFLQSPWIGVGYQAYWVQGFSEPERLWSDFFITSRSGFHFHNTYIETAVETGVVGLFLLCGVMLAMVFGHLKRLLGDTYNNESYVLVGVALLLLIRSFVEIDVLFPYQIGSFLFYFAAARLTMASTQPQPSFRPRKRVEYAAS